MGPIVVNGAPPRRLSYISDPAVWWLVVGRAFHPDSELQMVEKFRPLSGVLVIRDKAVVVKLLEGSEPSRRVGRGFPRRFAPGLRTCSRPGGDHLCREFVSASVR